MEKIVVERKLNEPDFLKLYSKLKRYEAEIRLIRIHNNNLKNRIGGLEKQAMQEPRNKIEKPAGFMEKRVRNLEETLRSKKNEIEYLKSVIKRFNSILSDIGNFYVLKKLDTLGFKEFSFKGRILNIRRNDMLLVDNPNIFSNEVISLLKNRVFVVVNRRPVSKKIENELPFVFIGAESLKIEEDRYFGFVEKKHFESEKNKTKWFNKIVEDYKKEKEQLISG